MNKDKSELFKSINQAGMLSSIPFLLAGGPLLGFWLGSWIDGRWGTEPYAKFILMILGFIGASLEVIRLINEVKRLQK